MRPPILIARSGAQEWTAYSPRPEDPMAIIRQTAAGPVGVAPDEGLLPYGGATPEYSALFPSLADALSAVLAYGASLWDAFDPTPLCVSRETPRTLEIAA